MAKVADFGISRPLSDESMTMRVGTTRWTAPEVLSKELTVYTSKADVYSFGTGLQTLPANTRKGIVLWEVVAKKLPFEEKGNFGAAVEDAVLRGERPPIPEGINPYFKKLITDCWEQDYNRRPDFEQVISVLVPMLEEAEKIQEEEEARKTNRKKKKKKKRSESGAPAEGMTDTNAAQVATNDTSS